jgi:carboxymethylenebutenolidase
MYDAVLAETIRFDGDGGDQIEGYLARPLGPGPFGGVVVIHHLPGYDAWSKEVTRTLAVNGFAALCPNLYSRDAPGASPDDAAALVRSRGGVPDERLVGDVAGAASYLRALTSASGRVGVIGHCSGGRQSVLAACELDLDACVDCYGAFVVGHPSEGHPLRVSPLYDVLPKLSAPLLGLFGKDDRFPSPDHVDELAGLLTKYGKTFEFHSYDGAGHGFFAVNRPAYRPEAAVDGWRRIVDFFGTHLAAREG